MQKITRNRYLCVFVYVLLYHVLYFIQESECIYIMGKRPYTAARKAANARYIKEKTVSIQAYLPPIYREKLNKIAEKQGTSKAQVLKNMIDTMYLSEFDNE